MTSRLAHAAAAAMLMTIGAGTLEPPSLSAQTLELADALDAALESHPTLAAAVARVSAAREAGEAARSAWLPGAALSATLTHFQEPMVVAPLHSLDITSPPRFDRTLVQGQLGAQYTLFDGTRTPRIRGADVAVEASEIERNDTEMGVLEETSAAYLSVLVARAVREAASARVEALEAEHVRAAQQLAAGTVPELEVLRAAATLQGARADEATARAQVGAAERSLARWMGLEATALTDRPLADLQTRGTAPRGDASSGPAVRGAQRAVAAAHARLAEQRGGRLPTLEAGAGLLDFGTVSGRHVTEWQAGVQLSWPLFTGGARSASVRRATAEVTAAERALDAATLRAAQTADAAQTSVVEAEERARALELAVVQWEEVTRIEALALDAGSGAQRDLLLAEAGLFEARAGRARAHYEAILARIRLARAEGVLDRDWMTEALETRP